MVPEGVEGLVQFAGTVEKKMNSLLGGVQSGLAHTGALNIPMFQVGITSVCCEVVLLISCNDVLGFLYCLLCCARTKLKSGCKVSQELRRVNRTISQMSETKHECKSTVVKIRGKQY